MVRNSCVWASEGANGAVRTQSSNRHSDQEKAASEPIHNPERAIYPEWYQVRTACFTSDEVRAILILGVLH